MLATPTALERLYKSTSATVPPVESAPFVLDQNQNSSRSFTDTVKELGEVAVESLGRAEETALKGLSGTADPHSVVEALAAAEMALETAVTVRDKVVEAYQEVLRMPV